MNDKGLLLKRLRLGMSANSNEEDVKRMYSFITENIEIVHVLE